MSVDIYEGINVEALRKRGDSEEDILVIAGLYTFLDEELDRLIACVEVGGLSIDAVDHKSGNNLMIEAAAHGAQSIVRYLIKNGADVNYRNPIDGNTAVHLAMGRKRLNCLRRLLDAGADRAVPNQAGMTPSDFGKDSNFVDGLEMLSRLSQTPK